MSAIKKSLSKNRIKLTITVAAGSMKNHFEAKYRQLSPSISLPGFRPGQAPRAMVIEAIGHTRLAQAALEAGLNEGYQAALSEHRVFPVTEPSVSIVKHPAFGEDSAQDELIFDVEFDILPEVKIGNWRKIKVKKIDPDALKVSADEVKKVLEYLRRQAAKLSDVARPAKIGDWVQVSFKGILKHVVQEKLSSASFPLVLGESNMVPGFEDKIVGMKKDEKKEFDLTFPKDFQVKEYTGQKVRFELGLEEVKSINSPALNDSFAAKFGRGSLSELKKAVKGDLEREKRERQEQSQRAQIGEQIIKMTGVDLPSSLVEKEMKRMRSSLEEELRKKSTTFDDYLKKFNLTEEKINRDLRDQARRNLTLGVGLGEIAKSEKVVLSGPESTAAVYRRIIEVCAK